MSPPRRKALPIETKRAVLAEAGYRCAVPTCRTILAIDLHHIVHVSDDGSDDSSNLLALCPTCHALHHRKEISQDAIFTWKSILVSLNQGFDRETLDLLLFLNKKTSDNALYVSGDGVLRFARLIASDLASFELVELNAANAFYQVSLTAQGALLVGAWLSGNRDQVRLALEVEKPT